ncbi:MAG TPA: NAD(P)/FAD-dependent oxidoreductase [Candidatus Nanopelagicaceae bacterium]
MAKPRVVILGGGFGGLATAEALGHDADITIVDRNNYQTFLPLLYQVSTAGIAADHIAYPIRGALRKSGGRFHMGSPISIDHKNKTVKLDSSEVIPFDHLVVAIGSVTADFDIPGVTEFGLGMKSIQESLTIRSEIMRRYEDLCRFQDDTRLKIVIVGGGPTGVEMSGALAELIKGPLRNDQAEAAAKIDVYLVEAGPRILPMFDQSLTDKATSELEKLGVTVLVKTAVKSLESGQINFNDGSSMRAHITVWAAGVTSSPAIYELNVPTEGFRLKTEQTMQVAYYPYVWAVGDCAGAKGANGRFLPQVAPVAKQQGKFVAAQIKRANKGQTLKEFVYKDKGAMATIGRHKAVIQIKGLKISGPIAWFGWLFLHIFYLMGARNRIGTFVDWTWNYLTFDRGNRYIMDSL